jgi:hypothetical protein
VPIGTRSLALETTWDLPSLAAGATPNIDVTVNKEVKRRADVVGIFPSEASIIRLIGAALLEANDEWQMRHRYMGVEAMGEMLNPPPTNETLQLPPKAA